MQHRSVRVSHVRQLSVRWLIKDTAPLRPAKRTVACSSVLRILSVARKKTGPEGRKDLAGSAGCDISEELEPDGTRNGCVVPARQKHLDRSDRSRAVSKPKDYQASSDWAEQDMTLNPTSTTALCGDVRPSTAAAHWSAMGGRPSIDPAASTGPARRAGAAGSPARRCGPPPREELAGHAAPPAERRPAGRTRGVPSSIGGDSVSDGTPGGCGDPLRKIRLPPLTGHSRLTIICRTRPKKRGAG